MKGRIPEYKCTECGRLATRDTLTVKRIQFTGMGTNGKVVQSRVRAWLCKGCLAYDADFSRPAMAQSPGFKGTKYACRNDEPKSRGQENLMLADESMNISQPS